MSDYLGPNQTRVLDSEDRSFESVIYQRKKPPLSSELDLTSNLSSLHAQDVARMTIPSGVVMTGILRSGVSEALCNVGDVVTSSSYAANTFKWIALDKGVETKNLVAWVNGWPLLIQGSNSLDENNIIILPAPPTIGYRVDFVFLEVWRKLIEVGDTIYKYGNVLYGGTNPSNDLIDPAIGIETSLRIQTQYRIRIAPCDIENYPDGFDPNQVFVQGPLSTPISTCTNAYFSQVPGDPGLWRAGAGDSAAQEDLETVDGYTYAIPLFAVHRRNTSNYDPDSDSNGAGKSLANYLAGYASDRPDNLYNNWVVANDILDMKHIVAPALNMKEICESGFQKLTRGELRGVMAKTTLGEDHFGTILIQADAVSDTDKDGSTKIATGDGIRRIYSNAELTQPDTLVVRTVNDKTMGTVGAVWAISDRVQIDISSPSIYPPGSTILSIDEIYIRIAGTVLVETTDYNVINLGSSLVSIEIIGTTLPGTSDDITIDYTITLVSGNGLTAVPEAFLEFRREDSTVCIASQDADIRLRTSAPVSALDGTHFNMLSNNGGYITEQYNFGHQMTYHALGNGTTAIQISRTIEGYPILGVISAQIGGAYQTITVVRTATFYSITFTGIIALNTDIELTLYTGVKFFSTNKQGRAITDTFEMSEFSFVSSGSISYTIDSTNKAILALASTYANAGQGMAYVDGTMTALVTTNAGLPTDSTKSKAVVTFSAAPSAGSLIEIPALMKSAISSSEGYTFFYHKVPYQGLLDSTATGTIEAVGPAITTTAGSGTITDYSYSEGTATFIVDSTDVTGTNTSWSSTVKAGYVIASDTYPEKQHIISQVDSDTHLLLSSPAEIPSGSGNYTITALDQPSFSTANIIDRLPTYSEENDAAAKNENISTMVSDGNPVLETRIISKVQDMLTIPPNVIEIGVGTADRGKSQIYLTEEYGPLGLGNLGLRFEKLDASGAYQKTYQSYILNKDNEGELYLMVVSSETGNDSTSRKFNEFSNSDTVDIFQLPTRPIINRRSQ